MFGLSQTSPIFAYEKAVEGDEIVLNKLYPKKGRVEVDGKLGYVLNGSYTQTFLVGGSATYFWSEEWGFAGGLNIAIVGDKDERGCIENFYNDPNYAVSAECGGSDALSEDADGDANFGPAYVPIRKLKYVFTGDFVWNPVYGKQIVLLSATNHFDFFATVGGGIAMSDYSPLQKDLPDGTPSRSGSFCVKSDANANPPKCETTKNPGTLEEAYIGESGRPALESQTNILLHLAVGQRFHFAKRWTVLGSLDTFTLLGTPNTFDNFMTLTGGVGVRF